MKMIPKKCRLTTAITLFGLLIGRADAAIVTLQGTFSSSFDTGGSSYQGVESFSGSWSLNYDSDALPASGDGILQPQLTDFQISPNTIGLTTFNTSNVMSSISFSNYEADYLLLAGSIDGLNLNVISDDFRFHYLSSLLTSVELSTGIPGADQDDAPSGSFTTIPEPSSALLCLLSVLPLLRRRKH